MMEPYLSQTEAVDLLFYASVLSQKQMIYSAGFSNDYHQKQNNIWSVPVLSEGKLYSLKTSGVENMTRNRR